jgi:hypothetical protein
LSVSLAASVTVGADDGGVAQPRKKNVKRAKRFLLQGVVDSSSRTTLSD